MGPSSSEALEASPLISACAKPCNREPGRRAFLPGHRCDSECASIVSTASKI
jgi:hypothetical protein